MLGAGAKCRGTAWIDASQVLGMIKTPVNVVEDAAGVIRACHGATVSYGTAFSPEMLLLRDKSLT